MEPAKSLNEFPFDLSCVLFIETVSQLVSRENFREDLRSDFRVHQKIALNNFSMLNAYWHSWYFEIFWPHAKLPLDLSKPEKNNSLR